MRNLVMGAGGALMLALAPAAQSAEVSNFLLSNGMEVVVIPDNRAPVVTQMVWYKAGSADEPPGKSGIAHFFEHLMFKGTANHPAGEFSRAVSSAGGNENAFTSNDFTAYHQTVAPTELPRMMAFEADRMRNLVLTDAVIGPERDVILEERRLRVDSEPGAILGEEVQATLYQNQPYRIPVIGWMGEIEKLNRTDAIAFYDRFYAPNNAILVVAGDVTETQVREMAEATYGKVPRGPDLPPRIRPQEPEQRTARTVTLRDERVGVPSFYKQWVVPSYNTDANGEAEALDLLSEVLGGGARSRLSEKLVVADAIAASAGAEFEGTTIDPTSFTVYGAPRGASELAAVEAGIDREIKRIQDEGVTEAELTRAKNRYVRAMVFAQDSAEGLAQIYGATLATGGTVKEVQEWPDRIKAVMPAQVQAVAQKYLQPNRSVTAYLLPPENRPGAGTAEAGPPPGEEAPAAMPVQPGEAQP
ncbi:MAG: peptidase M16 [Mesorhizobium amorphae]|nr:MAG: peptidase M16 [Mesorhizobium amorphae]